MWLREIFVQLILLGSIHVYVYSLGGEQGLGSAASCEGISNDPYVNWNFRYKNIEIILYENRLYFWLI